MVTRYRDFYRSIRLVWPTFKGRIGYRDYSFAMINLVIIAGIGAMIPLILAVLTKYAIICGILSFALAIFVAVSTLSLGTRRLHDTGRSGCWQFLYLATTLGGLFVQILMTGDAVGSNEYGPGLDSRPKTTGFRDLREGFRNLKPAFKGRMTYKEFGISYWVLWIICTLVNSIFVMFGVCAGMAGIVEEMMMSMQPNMAIDHLYMLQSLLNSMGWVLCGTGVIIVIWLAWSSLISVRRLHDAGRSAWNYLWILFPVLGVFIPLCMCFADTDENNEFGEKPCDERM